MMQKSIPFETMPKHYTLCFNKECPLAEQCLRYLAACSRQLNNDLLTVVNPLRNSGANCRFFKENKVVTVAYGMIDSFHQVKADHIGALHQSLYDKLGRSNFFRYKNGTLPITPKIQQVISNIFRKYGYEMVFDSLKEEYPWE